jgi:hypothetical protein
LLVCSAPSSRLSSPVISLDLQEFVHEGCDVADPTVVARQGMDWTKLDLKKASVVRKEGLSAVSLCLSLLIFFFAYSG